MKYLKMFAATSLAVAAVMTSAGTSSASALENTALCLTNTNPCTKLTGASTIEMGSTNVTFSTNIATAVCNASTMVFVVNGGTVTGGPEPGEILGILFNECKTTTGTSCTVKSVGFAAASPLQHTTGVNGVLTMAPGLKGDPGAKVECGVLINCTFTTKSAQLRVEGGSPLRVIASAISLERSGVLCPKTSTLTTTYSASAPNSGSLFVTG